MRDLKIKVNNEAESREVQELLFELGYKWHGKGKTVSYLNDVTNRYFGYLVAWSTGCFTNVIQMGCGSEDAKETTIAELRSMVKPMKEYLNKNTYEYKQAHSKPDGDWVCIPEGAEIAIQFKTNPDEYGIVFYKNGGKSCMSKNNNNWQHDSNWTMSQLLNENYHEGLCDLSHKILWQRPQQPEALPFIDDNPQSLNEQYAEIEQVRQQSIDATLAERQSTYGNFEDVAFVTENIMSILGSVRVNGLSELPNTHRMALYMIASKMARIVNGDFNHFDSWHDIGGYSKLIENLVKENNNG